MGKVTKIVVGNRRSCNFKISKFQKKKKHCMIIPFIKRCHGLRCLIYRAKHTGRAASSRLVKTPRQIETELREKFKDLGVEYDPSFAKSVIEESQRHSELHENIEGPESAGFEDFLHQSIDESIRDLENWHNIDLVRKELGLTGLPNKPDMSSDDDAIRLDLEMQQMALKFKPTGLNLLLSMLEDLNTKMESNKSRLALEPLSQMFDIATQIPDAKMRERGIFLVGNLLYNHPAKVRADIINESFYIQALVANRQNLRAFMLWSTRMQKEPLVQEERFWWEMGIKIQIARMDLELAEQSAATVWKKFSYLHPSVIENFITVYSQMNQMSKVSGWLARLNTVRKRAGITSSVEELNIQDDEDNILSYLNQQDPISFKDIVRIVSSLVACKADRLAMSTINCYTKRASDLVIPLASLFKHMSLFTKERLLPVMERELDEIPRKRLMRSLRKTANEEVEMKNVPASQSELVLKVTEALKGKTLPSDVLIRKLENAILLSPAEWCHVLRVLLQGNSRQQREIAIRILDEMNNSCLESYFPKPTDSVYAIFMSRLLKEKNKLDEIVRLHQISANQIEPSDKLIRILLCSFVKHKQFDQFLNYAKAAVEAEGVAQSSGFYRTLMQNFVYVSRSPRRINAPQGEPREFLRFFVREMFSRITPDIYIAEPLLESCILQKDLIACIGALQKMKSSNFSIPSKAAFRMIDLLYGWHKKIKHQDLKTVAFRERCILLKKFYSDRDVDSMNPDLAMGVVFEFASAHKYKPLLLEREMRNTDAEENELDFMRELNDVEEQWGLEKYTLESLAQKKELLSQVVGKVLSHLQKPGKA